MTGACARCGADDELLFTCRHCQRWFCERHELPHHACQFSSRQDASEPSGTDDAPEPTPDSATEPTPASEPPAASGATTADPEPATTTATEVESEPPGTAQAMDSRRAVGVVSQASSPRSLGEWLARQTYLTLVFKVGGLALLINVAFYGGVALTLYDPFGLL